MAHSLYNLEFKRDANEIELCKTSISLADIRSLKSAIEDLYYFEFVLDDLPIRGFVGHFEEGGIAPLHEHKVWVFGWFSDTLSCVRLSIDCQYVSGLSVCQ